jgi:hypothetical protein
VAVTSFTPPVDAEPIAGDCPYLTKTQVETATGDRVGKVRIRAATPQPVCEFTGSNGNHLATIRVLQYASADTAMAAVDYYVPPDASNPETRVPGWTGGAMRTDSGSIVAVAKGGYAVVADSNQETTVDTRQLVLAAVAALAL